MGGFQDPLSDGRPLHERQLGEPFKGPVIPFGSMTEHHPISAEVPRFHQFGKKVLPGIFQGYALFAVKGEILFADIEEQELFGVSQIHAGRLNAKKALTP